MALSINKVLPVGESVVDIGMVNRHVHSITKARINLLPQFGGGRVIFGEVQVVGSAVNHGLTSNKVMLESIDFDEVHPVLVVLNGNIVFVGWANEDTHNSFDGFVAHHVDFVAEWLVVQTFLFGADVPAVGFVLNVVDIHGLLDVCSAVFEVGYKLVYFHAFHRHSGKSDIIVGVSS